MNDSTREHVERLAGARRDLLESLAQRPSGLSWCARHTDIADEVVRRLHDDLVQTFPNLPQIALIATGGYGRRELSPYSDIDITVVPSIEGSEDLDRALRVLFQDLHWAFCTALRLNVGYAYRLISDAPGLDATTRTGLMDMRHLAGSYDLTQQLERALQDSLAPGEFILSKITEREAMFRKHHDTPLVVEPNLKEGAGGLRSFHCANWIREAIGERAARPSEAFDTLVRFRNLLHLKAGRNQDNFSRQRQAEVADHLQTDLYVMMGDLVKHASELHAFYLRVTDKLREGRFRLSPGVMAVQGEARVLADTDAGEAAVGIAIATKLGLDVSDLPMACSRNVQGAAALYALSGGEKTLRNLDRSGLLQQILPELTACRTLMPTDTVHTFTVFEHTIRTLRHLDRLEPGTFLGDLKDSLNDLEPLHLALLLHDIGKIHPTRPHSEVGAEMADAICRRMNLAENIHADVVWLIREHLTMARFIRVRDLQHPATIAEFAEIVGEMDRLNMLTLLTWADVNAVSDSAWTNAQDTFLRELYSRTEAHLMEADPKAPDPSVTRQRLLRQLKNQSQNEIEVQAFIDSLPAYYLVSTPTELVRLHMEFSKQAREGQPTVEIFHRAEIGATEFTVCTLDAPGLLSRLLAVLYAYDLSLSAIRVSTTGTYPAVALDVFTVSFGGRPVPPATSKQVSASLLDVLTGRRSAEEILRSKEKDPSRKQRIFTYTYTEGLPGVLEIRAPRGRGMPYRFSRLIAQEGWNVVSARVGQWAGNAAAAFYVTGREGNTLTREEVDRALSEIPSEPRPEVEPYAVQVPLDL